MKLKNACFALAILFCVSMAHAQVTGSGTKNDIPVWTGTTTLGNSVISQSAGNVGIGTKKPDAKLDVVTTSTTEPAISATASSTSGNAVGIVAVTGSPTASAIFAQSTTTTGPSNAITAETDGIGGAAANFTATNTSADGSGGIYVVTAASDATAGFFINQASGNILVGQVGNPGMNVFRVDGTGKGFFDGGTQTGGADFAESVAVAKEFALHEPGDLLIVDVTGKRQMRVSSEPYSTLVAGIYSTKPGVLATAHKMGEIVSNEIPLAIVGIVPCKVSAENGPIQPGDLLVTSSTPGHAMKGTDRGRMLGAVVGKALEPLSEGNGVIQVLVTLQ